MENEVKNYFVEMDELYRRRNMEKFRNVIQHDESSNESVPSSSGYINVVSNDKVIEYHYFIRLSDVLTLFSFLTVFI